MSKKDFLQKKYEELNKLKNMLQKYPNEYKESIVHAMNKVTEEICEYVEKNKSILKKKKHNKERRVPEFTIEELKKYDGKNGASAYVAVDGTVYDVTPIKSWLDGKHHGLKAGEDLSQYFSTCHSNERRILDKLRVVGTLKG